MMEQLPENNSAQAGNSAATAATSLGRTLRETRERLGLSVADVANQIKFAPRQIEALEADDFQHLPEATFLRGFVRSYAKILQLDAQTLLSFLPQAKAASTELLPASVEVPFPDAHSLLRQNLIWLGAAALLAVIAGGFALWNFMSPLKQSKVVQVETPLSLPAEMQIIPAPLVPGERVAAPSAPDVVKAQSSVPGTKTQVSKAVPQIPATKPAAKFVAPTQAQPTKSETKSVAPIQAQPTRSETKSVAPTQAQPTRSETKSVAPTQAQSTKPKHVTVSPAQPAKPATQPDASSQVTQLRLVFGEESWTEIKDRDGKIISSQVNPRGSELIVYGRAPFSMLIGHGLSVRLYRQDKPVDLTPYINKYSEVAHLTLK